MQDVWSIAAAPAAMGRAAAPSAGLQACTPICTRPPPESMPVSAYPRIHFYSYSYFHFYFYFYFYFYISNLRAAAHGASQQLRREGELAAPRQRGPGPAERNLHRPVAQHDLRAHLREGKRRVRLRALQVKAVRAVS